MSEVNLTPQTALNGAAYDGFARISEAPVMGMITLRGPQQDAGFAAAVAAATGCDLPPQRGLSRAGEVTLCWMSPDELMVLVPRDQAAGLTAQLSQALAGSHAMALDVSDARSMFYIVPGTSVMGPREVLAKLCPVDLHPASFGPGEVRRTRLAQVPAAFWMDAEGAFTLICFRSVAQYAFDLLKDAARTGADVGYFAPLKEGATA